MADFSGALPSSGNAGFLAAPVCRRRRSKGNEAVRRLLEAQFPLLAVSILGLPSLAAPTGLVDGLPIGVQSVAARYQKETCLAAGEVIEDRNPIKGPIDPTTPDKQLHAMR
jgi:Asp-tRNA(Asn)/Glu-tRNA(Gln) amidotransferase A subunit family amidase